ncbi:MAG TPA: hypothetical protein VJ858_06655 [Acidimicrobiia bacterium]|nr:hypothetical protein [Acidimicrobiia bacterium]
MTLNFLTKRRRTTECTHEKQMRIEVAGMSRDVCESCGRVSVGYVDDHIQVAARDRGQTDSFEDAATEGSDSPD